MKIGVRIMAPESIEEAIESRMVTAIRFGAFVEHVGHSCGAGGEARIVAAGLC